MPPRQRAAASWEPAGEHLYVVGTGKDGRVKIGRTRRSQRQRLRELQTGNPDTLRILRWFDGLAHMEPRLHEYYARYRISGEWFDFRDHDPVQQVELAIAYLEGIEPVLRAQAADWRAKLHAASQNWSSQLQALQQRLAELEMQFARERAFAELTIHARDKEVDLACEGVPRWVISRFVVGATMDEIDAGVERARQFVADLANGYGNRAA